MAARVSTQQERERRSGYLGLAHKSIQSNSPFRGRPVPIMITSLNQHTMAQ